MKKMILGFVMGFVSMGFLGWAVMPGLMIHEKESPYSVEETVAKIKSLAESQSWVVPSVKKLHQSVSKHGGGKLPPVHLVNLCNADHAYKILNEDQNKKISVFMPCTVSVYEKDNGRVYIGSMNAGLMGKIFGGTVAKVMAQVSLEQQKFIRMGK